MPNQIKIFNRINSFDKTIKVTSDKSLSIRAILLASQAIGISTITNLLESEDVLNAIKSIKKLGIECKKIGNQYKILGYGLNGFNIKKNTTINAGNSGTLARLILGLLVKSEKTVKIVGDKSLSKRDFSRVTEPLKKFGTNIISKKNSLPVKILGSNFLRPINYFERKGSAQCKSAVMLAALNTPGTTIIKAKKSRNHTEILFKYLKLPINIKSKGNFDFIEVTGLKQFNAFDYIVPGDISSSAFFIVLTTLSKNSKIKIKNINVNKSRIGIIKILKKMNCKIILKNKKIYKGEETADIVVESSINIKGISCPSSLNSAAIDEFLVIFLIAAKAKGISTFKNLGELNKKESPRLDIAVDVLKNIGIKVERKNDDIKVFGNPNLKIKKNIHIKNFLKDHRVFMMSCIAALTFGGNWKIDDKDSINTSFPIFLNLLKKLGAKIN
ncbi:MAG: 3-phosphoshikimate 1-carboxyvinyltransferase [Candidatus Pelagibacter sp.]